MYEHNSMFYCDYCGEPYEKEEDAAKCLKEHNIVYMAISASDLNKLQQFLFSHDQKLLTRTLTNQIQLYTRRAAERQFHG